MRLFQRDHLLKFLTVLLRPIARLCLRNDVVLQEIGECLKQALIKEGLDELKRKELKPTISHLSIVTGLHRKDVTRLINSDHPPIGDGPLAAQVITKWRSDPAYKNKLDKPKLLSCEGASSEFAELVRLVNRELNPGTILKELERVGAVRRTEQGLKLIDGAYVTRKNSAAALEMLADHISTLVTTVEENVSGDNRIPNLHLKTEFDAIPDCEVEKVKEWLLKEGTKFHEHVHSFLLQHDADCNLTLRDKVGRNKVSLVAYVSASSS